MTISANTIEELETYINNSTTKLVVLVGYDDLTSKWVVLGVDSETGKLK